MCCITLAGFCLFSMCVMFCMDFYNSYSEATVYLVVWICRKRLSLFILINYLTTIVSNQKLKPVPCTVKFVEGRTKSMMSCSITLGETFVLGAELNAELDEARRLFKEIIFLGVRPVVSSKPSSSESIVSSKKRMHSFSSELRNCRASSF